MKKIYSLTDFGVTKHKTVLKNGLRVIFIEKPFAPIYAKMMIGAGSVFNSSDNGLAHFTEHIIMSGNKNLSKENFSRIIDSIGGYKNASTSKEYMSVDCAIAETQHLPQMSLFFSEALKNIYLTKESLKKEKEIIQSEIQRQLSRTEYKDYLETFKILTKESPYQYSNLGEIEAMSYLTISEVENFFSTYCVVENMVLVIAGGCTLSDIENNFSHINFLNGQKSILPVGPKVINKNQRLLCKQDIPQSETIILFEGPIPYTRDSIILKFVLSFVHDGISSRFYKKIRNEKGLAYSVQNVVLRFNKTVYLGTGTGIPSEKTDEAIETILECYQNLIVEGMSDKEIRERINTLWFSFKRCTERTFDWVREFEDCLYEDNKIVGDFPAIFNFRETITSEEIKSVLQKYITFENFHLIVRGREPSKKYL